MGHPAHVHFFKNAILELKEKGHEIKIVCRDKEVALKLLDAYGFEYELYGKHRKSLIGKICEIPYNDYLFYKVAREFKPDILTGILNYTVTHVGKLIKKPSIIFTDTEHAVLANKLVLPFADAICTPECYSIDLGRKHVRYDGYHELAYLHPNYFKPDPSVLNDLGLTPSDKFFVLRFISWNAGHDAKQYGISTEMKHEYISKLEQYGKVFVSSESKIEDDFEKYKLEIAPEKLHSLLSYAYLYIGESSTMATESGILGTPSIYISSLVGTMGNFDELDGKYGLVSTFNNSKSAITSTLELLEDTNLKNKWKNKRKMLLNEKNDVTQYIVDFLENYPECK